MVSGNDQIVVSPNTGVVDGLQSAVRYIVVLVAAFTALLGLLKAHDIAGIVTYIQTNLGTLLSAVAGLIGLATAAYGIFKTKKRGDALVTVADAAPNSVAKVQ